MRKIILFTFLALATFTTQAQTVIHTEDITNFWQAFDSTQNTNNKEKQIYFIQKYYLDKATVGLKYTTKPTYLEGQNAYNAQNWFTYISENKEKLIRIRPYTLDNLENQKKILQTKFGYFKELYPDFNRLDVYFVIGIGDFGGQANEKNVVIAAEVMAKDTPDWGISMVLHEFVHTLQALRNDALLQHTILEGMADFVAELANQKSLTETYPGGYIEFGNKNEKAVWNEYKKYIYSSETNGKFFDWLYGSKGREINETQVKDLGYFMGYTFCKAYYKNATNKKLALKEIIEWDLSTSEKAREFLLKSGYVPKKDLKFIKKFKFSPVIEQKIIVKKELYGYKQNEKEVVFTYKLGKSENNEAINKISVAGNFNGWNPSDDNYQMTFQKNRTYELRIQKSKFEKDKKYLFKFVTNGVNWLGIPEKALNIDEESGNLILKID